MTPTYAHPEHARSPFAGAQAGNDSGSIAIPESAHRPSGYQGESPKKSKPTPERDSFLVILLRALGAPHI